MASPAAQIAFITTSFPRWHDDEASIFVGRMVDALGDIGCTGIIAVPFDCAEATQEERNGFVVYRVRYGLFRRGSLSFGAGMADNVRRQPMLLLQLPLLFFQLFRAVWSHRAKWEVVHAQWLATAPVAALLSFLTRRPYLVTLRGTDVRLCRSRFVRLVTFWSLHNAANVTTVGNEAAIELRALPGFPTERLVVVENGVQTSQHTANEIEEAFQALGLKRSQSFLVFVGRVVSGKRIERLVDLLSLSVFSEHTLLIIGRMDEEYRETIVTLLEHEGLTESVRFLGSQSPTMTERLIAGAEFYVTASAFEGRPNAVLEALSLGVPALVSDIPAHRGIVKDGVNGFVFLDGALDQLNTRIEDLRQREDGYAGLSRSAKESVAHLSWKRSAEAYRDLYQAAIRRAGSQK